MIGITGLFLDGDLAPQHREYAEMIRASGEALLTIINDLVESTLELWAKLTLAKDIELASAIKAASHPDCAGIRGGCARS